MSIRSQLIGSLEELERLAGAWRDLWRGASAATIFQSPDWLVPWWRHFSPGRLRCNALWRGGDLVGCAAFYEEADSGRFLPLGISLSDYTDIVVDKDDPAVCHTLQFEIARLAQGAEICLPDVSPDAAVLSLQGGQFQSRCDPANVCPELILGSADTPLENVPAHQRQNLRTAENRARRRGCSVTAISPEHLRDFIPALMRLHSARQQHFGRDGLERDGRVLPFFVEAFSALAPQAVVRAYCLTCDDRIVGGYVGFQHRGRASYYFGGFDPAFAFVSPGTILIGNAIRCAAAEGAHTFDFLRGAEAYKYAWGARDRQLLSLSLVRHRNDVELAS